MPILHLPVRNENACLSYQANSPIPAFRLTDCNAKLDFEALCTKIRIAYFDETQQDRAKRMQPYVPRLARAVTSLRF